MGRSGDDFELWIKNIWPIAGTKGITLTKNSGAVHQDADMSTSEYQIEAKDGYADGVTFQRAWINKVQRAAKLRGRMPLMMHRTLQGDAYAILRAEDFFGLIEELHELKEKERDA